MKTAVKHRDQKKLGEESIYFILHVLIAINHEGKLGKDLRQLPGGPRGMLLNDLLLLDCSIFLIHSRNNLPRGSTSYNGLGPPMPTINHENAPIDLPTDMSYGGISSFEVIFSQMPLACFKWTDPAQDLMRMLN